MSTKTTFSPREIADIINNAVVFAKAPASLSQVSLLSDERLAKLYEYATALFGPLWSEIDEGYLLPEEAVLICLAGALTGQLKYVVKSDKLPASSLIEPLTKQIRNKPLRIPKEK